MSNKLKKLKGIKDDKDKILKKIHISIFRDSFFLTKVYLLSKLN